MVGREPNATDQRPILATSEFEQGNEMNTSFPVAALTTLGALAVLLGFFAAGDIAVVAVGFGAIFGAGLLTHWRAAELSEQPYLPADAFRRCSMTASLPGNTSASWPSWDQRT